MKDGDHLRRPSGVIPSMGGDKIGRWLEEYAASCHPGAAIVEVGSWLGAGTVHLARGAVRSGAPIHCYDRWRATDSEVQKAADAGVAITSGDDLLPLFLEAVAPYPVELQAHRGALLDARWSGGAIGLYVDDASKRARLWEHAMATFSPSFVPGTIMVLMDYHYDEKAGPDFAAQKAWVAAQGGMWLEQIEDRLGGTGTAVFRWRG